MNENYSFAIRLAHWFTVALVIAQVSLAILNFIVYEQNPILAEWLIQSHISLGFVILLVTLIRIFLRLRSPVPKRSMIKVIRFVAHLNHILIYLSLLFLPLSGYLRLAALGFEIRLFNVLPLPTLYPDASLAASAAQWHKITILALAVLLFTHIVAALTHKRIDGVSVMDHMRL